MSKDNAAGAQDENTQFDSRGGDGKQDAQVTSKMFRDSPWFMRLPPAIQAAIQANSRRLPPRQYADRLQRYFKD
jgi:hypothetical protein